MPIDQQGLEQPKDGDKMIDQEGAGCQGPPAQFEDAKLKAQLQILMQIVLQTDQICMATLILSGPI